MTLYATQDTRGAVSNKVALWNSKPDLMDGQWFRGDNIGLMRPVEFAVMFGDIPAGKCVKIEFETSVV